MATVYRSALAALSQAVENSRDAHARNIWVVLEPEMISVIDDGHGMLPQIFGEDRDLVEMLEDDAKRGKLMTLAEIRRLISKESRYTVEWMMRFGALSAKLPDEGTQGEKGIGHAAYLTYGSNARISTLPSLELARAC